MQTEFRTCGFVRRNLRIGLRYGQKNLRKLKIKRKMDQLNQEPIYVMMVTVDKKWQKIEIQREKEVPVRRSAVSARYWRKHLEKTEAEKILREKLGSAEKILVGIGSEWKKKEGAEEEEILHAAEQLKKFLDGKDYYMITSLADEDAKRLPFDAGHIAVPHSVSFTEENLNQVYGASGARGELLSSVPDPLAV